MGGGLGLLISFACCPCRLFSTGTSGCNLCRSILAKHFPCSERASQLQPVPALPLTPPAQVDPVFRPPDLASAVVAGVSRGEAALVQARQGASVELSCDLAPTSTDVGAPKLFPLHVVEWVRLGLNIPILIKFGVYAPRVHPSYRGKSFAGAGGSASPQRVPEGAASPVSRPLLFWKIGREEWMRFNRSRFVGDGEPCM